MTSLLALFALAVAGIGLYGLAAPEPMARFVARWRTPTGFRLAAVLRLLFAGLLWLAAPATRAPAAVQVLAVLVLLGALALPLLGYGRYLVILDWWLRLPVPQRRLWVAPAAGLGLFLVWAVAG